jgi:hypothetical protein
MATITEFRCEICGTASANPVRWFVIQCGATELKVIKWDAEAAGAEGARHYCGEGHAGVYISRWLESACSPSKPDFTKASSGSREPATSGTA